MTQKDNVKQLIGKSLNAYNNKVLQQMDRIEKKNKEQNHKISILTNELDNDYLTKSEEGSVVSLEHSKEGMVYLDELQGNTMVNYCTDGSKEMTLNGDIDIEGTFVTTTEGVDNGLVDVMCEGNTLVNIIDERWYNGTTETKNNRECFKIVKGSPVNHLGITNIKSGVPYTLIYNYTSTELIRGTTNPFGRLHLALSNESGWVYDVPVKDFESNKSSFVTSISVFTIPTHIQFSSLMITGILRDIEGTVWLDKNILLLEGDWTEKEIPPYFEGMKSVGQDDENGHKIEILSNNRNLLDNLIKYPFNVVKGNTTTGHDGELLGVVKVKPNTKYIMSAARDRKVGRIIAKMSNRILLSSELQNGIFNQSTIYNFLKNNYANGRRFEYIINGQEYIEFTTLDDCNYIYVNIDGAYNISENGEQFTINNVQIEEGEVSTNYIQHESNKKQILLNEPLRGLPNGVKDRFVKIGGKWYIERNCKGFSFNDNQVGTSFHIEEGKNVKGIVCSGFNNKEYDYNKYQTICDKIPCRQLGFNEGGIGYFYENPANFMFMFSLDENLESARQKILSCKFVSKLKTPIYESLEIEPTLNTYTDVTHISNNSLIPCNMKVQNSGYNAIIKPSTLYTIALDTNKSGTIGMNLGGVKGTTTNNVLTLTTPATLTDDSLRLYGKGIKGSKVRLLEGDKTNWIPSHFEGMKSSFEDKFDTTDNTYKMEILSNNKNLFDITKVPNITTVENLGDCLKITGYANDLKVVASFLTPNKTYTTSTTLKEIQGTNNGLAGNIRLYNPKTRHWITSKTFIAPQNIKDYSIFLYGMQGNPSECIVSNIQIFEGNEVSLYTPHKSNKIQFSSIEPLRKWDRFVFKDNQLMIERGSGTFVLNNKNGYSLSTGGWENKTDVCTFERYKPTPTAILNNLITFYTDSVPSLTFSQQWSESGSKGREGISTHQQGGFVLSIKRHKLISQDINGLDKYLRENPIKVTYKLEEPTYEEIPFELQKIILEGYENGTLFFDTNIPPTSTITYAGETPIIKATKLNKIEVSNNTNDINDNIIPYLMDMDYRVVCLQLESNIEGVSMARLFGGTYEMLKRDIQSNRLSKEEYGYRLIDYFNAGKLTEEQVRELEDLK